MEFGKAPAANVLIIIEIEDALHPRRREQADNLNREGCCSHTEDVSGDRLSSGDFFFDQIFRRSRCHWGRESKIARSDSAYPIFAKDFVAPPPDLGMNHKHA